MCRRSSVCGKQEVSVIFKEAENNMLIFVTYKGLSKIYALFLLAINH